MTRNDLCWCGSGKKYKKCHMDFDERLRSMKFDIYRGQVRPPHSIIKNAADIEGIRKSGVVNDGALDLMGEMVQPGIDTATLDTAAHDYITDHGGIPACLNFEGFPKSVCISINDITTILDGYYADASRMYIVGGRTTPEAARLVEVAKECMNLGIEAARPWHFLGDIGAACDAHARANGCSVVTQLGGHGVGKDFHEEPFVPHVGEVDTGMLLVPGMVLTVEPMINAGKYKVTVDKKDGWTVRTKDGSLSAQWEKTILITETGTEVLSS